MKQVKLLDNVNTMLEAIVKDEVKKGKLSANKQSELQFIGVMACLLKNEPVSYS